MNFVLIFDADNTLWDTNMVFLEAQVAMLEVLEEAGILTDGPSRVDELRAVDRELIHRVGQHEYDFRLLGKALIYHFKKSVPPDTAAEQALQDPPAAQDPEVDAIAEAAAHAHAAGLERIPPLLPSVQQILAELSAADGTEQKVVTLIFSEGDVARLERILEEHDVRQDGYFDEIIIAPKSIDGFKQARDIGLSVLGTSAAEIIMIGDSMKRDIRPANEAGLTTVYVPGGFTGVEQPEHRLDRPDYQIEELSELPRVLVDVGFCLPTETHG